MTAEWVSALDEFERTLALCAMAASADDTEPTLPPAAVGAAPPTGPCPEDLHDRARSLLAGAREVEADLQGRIEAVRAELRRLPRPPEPATPRSRFETRA